MYPCALVWAVIQSGLVYPFLMGSLDGIPRHGRRPHHLEQAGSFLFLVRPRRFGKSLMASMLRCYYDVAAST